MLNLAINLSKRFPSVLAYASHGVRGIFEHKHIKKILGSNLALAFIATSFLPKTASLPAYTKAQEEIIAVKTVKFTTEIGLQYPVSPIRITQGFRLFHPALDLDGITGDPIHPIKAGRVDKIQYSRFGYGNAIIIDHGNGIISLYAHLSKIEVKEGDEVTTASEIGKMGSTGHSTGDHLHLEIRIDGRAQNPSLILPKVPIETKAPILTQR